MPPIPVHIDDPITPNKPQGVTPQSSAQEAQLVSENGTATTTAQGGPAYPAARPGAVAGPAPTPYAPPPQPQPSRTQPVAGGTDYPPRPQPGAVPVPSFQQPTATVSSTLPPPPKAGESTVQRQTAMPSQMQIPPPSQNYAPTHSTDAYVLPPATTQSRAGATTYNLGPVTQSSLQAEHPSGYHQDTSAQEMSAAQRSDLDGQERKPSIMGNLGGEAAGETAENMWNAVKTWASAAGEKLAETEESVWKRINGR